MMIRQGSVHPLGTGIEAGLSAVGDIFAAIASRAGTDVNTLSVGLEKYRAGQTGLLRMTWDNGDRTVLVNPNSAESSSGGICKAQRRTNCLPPSRVRPSIRESSWIEWLSME
jgi:hypothetical protein